MSATASKDESGDQIDSRMPLWMALIANSLNLALSVQFFWVPADAWIRPMFYYLYVLVIGAGALLVLPLVLFNLKRLRGRVWPKYAVILALTPVPLALLVEAVAHRIIGFHYSQ
jgi:hypothetical protein